MTGWEQGRTSKHSSKTRPINETSSYALPHPPYTLHLHSLADDVYGARELFRLMCGFDELQLEFAFDRFGRMGYGRTVQSVNFIPTGEGDPVCRESGRQRAEL